MIESDWQVGCQTASHTSHCGLRNSVRGAVLRPLPQRFGVLSLGSLFIHRICRTARQRKVRHQRQSRRLQRQQRRCRHRCQLSATALRRGCPNLQVGSCRVLSIGSLTGQNATDVAGIGELCCTATGCAPIAVQGPTLGSPNYLQAAQVRDSVAYGFCHICPLENCYVKAHSQGLRKAMCTPCVNLCPFRPQVAGLIGILSDAQFQSNIFAFQNQAVTSFLQLSNISAAQFFSNVSLLRQVGERWQVLRAGTPGRYCCLSSFVGCQCGISTQCLQPHDIPAARQLCRSDFPFQCGCRCRSFTTP